MKNKRNILIILLSMILICCVGTVCAADSNNTNMISDTDSNDEFISVSGDEKVDDSALSTSSEKSNCTVNVDLLSEDDDEYEDDDEDDDGEEVDWDEDEDNEDEEYEDEELDDEDIEEYLESLDTVDEYLNFIKYLIKEKGFRFNNHLEEEDEDEGYSLYATQLGNEKLYDGRSVDIYRGYEYYIPFNLRTGHVLDTYYPDVIYERFNQYSVDELYLGWLKWEEEYQLSLNISGDIINISLNSSNNTSLKLPSKYDLRNVNGQSYVTPVKNQEITQNCWAFAAIAALESHLLKSEGKTYDLSDLDIVSNYDFSENNLKNAMSSLGKFGANFTVNGRSYLSLPIAYFIRWSGPILESQDPFEYINNFVDENYKAFKHVQGVKFIPPRMNYTDNDKIKQAIYEYGGVATSMYWNPFFEINQNYYSFLNPLLNGPNHAICIVGWNDEYSATNFINPIFPLDYPPGDGAFIVKNSYGSDRGEGGYFYVSYYDTLLANFTNPGLGETGGYVFTSVENNTNFGKNYHYTPFGVTSWLNFYSKQVTFANQWNAICNETLTACGVYVNDTVYCTVVVSVDDINVTNKSIQLNYPGFHTIVFDTPVNITKGQTYKIAVTLTSNTANISAPIEAPLKIIINNKTKEAFPNVNSNVDESFYYNGVEWCDLTDIFKKCNFVLHAYTEYWDLIPTMIKVDDLSVVYGENNQIVATLVDKNNNYLKNYELIFNCNGEDDKVITNNEGKASLPIYDGPGVYKVTIHFLGDEKYGDSHKTITLTINSPQNNNQPTIQKKNVIIDLKDTKLGNSISIVLRDSDGNKLSSKKVTIKGKYYYNKKKTTDNKGKINIKTKYPDKIKVSFKDDANYYNSAEKKAYIYKNIKTIRGLEKPVKSNEEITLKLGKLKKPINVYIKIKNSNKGKIKINKKGEGTFKVEKYGLKPDKSYKLTFYSKDKIYRVKATHKIKVTK